MASLYNILKHKIDKTMMFYNKAKFTNLQVEDINRNSGGTRCIKQQYVECRVAHILASCPLARYLGSLPWPTTIYMASEIVRLAKRARS